MAKLVVNTIIKYWVIIAILCVAAFFRLYKLNSVPPSASLDEVSIGWNAYSILKTGNDEYGNKFPLILRAYDDYRPALYVYLVIPFILLFDLSVFAVRLPSVLLSIVSVALTYVFSKNLVQMYKKNNFPSININYVALAASFLLAISPWHIYISRLGHEVNAGLTFLIIAATSFVYACNNKKPGFLIFSSVFFSLSFASYQSEKLTIPILLFFIAILYKKFLLTFNKETLFSLFLLILLSVPTVLSTFNHTGLLRFSGTSVFTEGNPQYEKDRKAFMMAQENSNILQKIMYYPKLTSFKIFISNYLKHFNVQWLFAGGPYDQHKVPYTGLLFPVELVFILTGGLFLLKRMSKEALFIFLWIAVGPLPGAITTEAPHAMRSFAFLPMWQVLGGIGFTFFYQNIKKGKNIFFGAVFILMMFYIVNMFNKYFTVFPATQSQSFAYALHDAIQYVVSNTTPEETIRIAPIITAVRMNTNDSQGKYIKVSSFQTYMFYLFDSKFSPESYLKSGGTPSGGLGVQFEFDSISIQNFSAGSADYRGWYFGDYENFPQDIPVIYTAQYKDGTKGVYVGKI